MSTHHRLIVGIVALVASVGSGLGCSQQESSTTTTTGANAPNQKDRENAIGRLNDATKMLTESNVASMVPRDRLEKAQCAVVVPALAKGAFIVGGTRGSGVATCRVEAGWSGPIFVTLTGASVGLQAGGQSSDVLMLVNNTTAMNKLLVQGMKLGAGASVAAGPVGQQRGAGTDTSSNADILTYARTKGLFAGVDLSGVSVSQDQKLINAFYGKSADAQSIIMGQVQAPAEAQPFLNQVKAIFPAYNRLAEAD